MTQVSLNEVLPVRARRAIYVTYGIGSIAVSATQVGYAAIPGGDQPVWLTVTLAVVAFLAGPVTALAVTNTPAAAQDRTVELHGAPPWTGD